MAIGLFGLEECDQHHGIALPGHLFQMDAGLEGLELGALKARTPGASRAHSRLASPAPLVLDCARRRRASAHTSNS